MADTFFCLDIGESLIKITDAKKNGNEIDIDTIGYIATDSKFYSADNEKNITDEAAIITKLVASLKITKKNVSVVIPDAFTYSRILLMPFLNEKELISAIKYQADQFIPMPIDETNIDIEILQEFSTEKKLLVLMVASPKKLIDKIQSLTEMAGLLPQSVENELSASARFVTENAKPLGIAAGGAFIIVNIGWRSTSLYYFDPTLLLLTQTHNFKIGYELFIKEIMINTGGDHTKAIETLNVFDEQNTIIAPILNEFSTELKRFITLINEKNHTQVKTAYLINEAFRFASLASYLTTSLSIPAKALNPYGICRKSNSVESHKNELSLFVPAIGGNFR